MGTTNSPNMNLPIPNVSSEPGPQFATDINQALNLIDGHNHASGNGVPIGSNGLNITSDLAFNINNITSLRTARFTSTTATSGTDLNCLYVKGVDLYYNDANANNIRITQNGGLASTALTLGIINTTAIKSSNGTPIASSGFIRMVNNGDFVSWRNQANSGDDKIYFDTGDIFQVIGTGLQTGLIKSASQPTIATTGFQRMVNNLDLLSWRNTANTGDDNVFFDNTDTFKVTGAGGIQATQSVKIVDPNTNNIVTVQPVNGTSAYTLTLPSQPTSATAPIFINSVGSITATTIQDGNILGGTITGASLATNINLPGSAPKSNGRNVVVSNTNTSISHNICRGRVTSAGGVGAGEGFTVNKQGTGSYIVNPSSGFNLNDEPIVVATPYNQPPGAPEFLSIGAVSSSAFSVFTFTSSGATVDQGFYFIIMGLRTP